MESSLNTNYTEEELEIAVLIPCKDEELTIAKVVKDFKSVLPQASIYVYDNCSSDSTKATAIQAGAIVRSERMPGKGNVVRRMFADIDADVYILVDGDDTYDVSVAPKMVQEVIKGCDLVNGVRQAVDEKASYRKGHRFGNQLLSALVQKVFARKVSDMLSGYKAMSRRFVKSMPIFSKGFEIETEITVHAMELETTIGEIETQYRERPEGSESKLNTFGDGVRILNAITTLVRQGKPLLFFSAVGFIFALVAFILAVPVVITFLQTHKVPRLPTALLSTGLILLSSLSFTVGLILDNVTRARKETITLKYLSDQSIVSKLLQSHRSQTLTKEIEQKPREPEPTDLKPTELKSSNPLSAERIIG